jgi:small subunit ribosomal protein S21
MKTATPRAECSRGSLRKQYEFLTEKRSGYLTTTVFAVLNSGVAKLSKTKNWIFKKDGKRMAIVTINQGESIESALRRFKRKVMTEEIIKDAKKHAFFIPPGQKAKLKSALARKRNKKKGRMRTTPRD